MNFEEQLHQIQRQLEALTRKNSDFSEEIETLRSKVEEMASLAGSPESAKPPSSPPPLPRPLEPKPDLNGCHGNLTSPLPAGSELEQPDRVGESPQAPKPELVSRPAALAGLDSHAPNQAAGWQTEIRGPSQLEKFIGENLISKIGIIILIIGVAIGVKYSIDRDLITPPMRLVLGYLLAGGVLAAGIRLKPKYHNYSAVLVSGAMAMMYIVTYLGYQLYELIPQAAAFGLMVLFTLVTVISSLSYNRQVIAHIGLVCALGVPFLLGGDSGQVGVLFTYISIINAGILAISFKKSWAGLFANTFVLTWLIFGFWFFQLPSDDMHPGMAAKFSSLFFALFYGTFLCNKLIRKQEVKALDVILIGINSLIYYLVGYRILNHPDQEQLLGVFTVGTAALHFGVALLVRRFSPSGRRIFLFVLTQVLTFLTIAIPVQLDGNWVTMAWSVEAALLFWIGRSRSIAFYEWLSRAVVVCATVSLLHDCYFSGQRHETSVLNSLFLTSVVYALTMAFIAITGFRQKFSLPGEVGLKFSRAFGVAAAVLSVAAMYRACLADISLFWEIRQLASMIEVPDNIGGVTLLQNWDCRRFMEISRIDFSMLFFSALVWTGLALKRGRMLAMAAAVPALLSLLVFLFAGLKVLSSLQNSWSSEDPFFAHGWFNLGIKYVSFALVALTLWTVYRMVRRELKPAYRSGFEIFNYGVAIACLSYELCSLLKLAGKLQDCRLELTLLWGLCAAAMVAVGIWKKKQHVRFAALAIFAICTAKLIAYDLEYMETIGKTIVFVGLGMLLLLCSFLYNKFKHLIHDKENV